MAAEVKGNPYTTVYYVTKRISETLAREKSMPLKKFVAIITDRYAGNQLMHGVDKDTAEKAAAEQTQKWLSAAGATAGTTITKEQVDIISKLCWKESGVLVNTRFAAAMAAQTTKET